MHRRFGFILLWVTFMLVGSRFEAMGQFTTVAAYQYSTSTGGTLYDMTGGTEVFTGSVDDGSGGPYDIGFSFVFEGTTYTQFSINSNGGIQLGGNRISSSTGLNLDNPHSTPIIAVAYADLVTKGNTGLRFKVFGSEPNRVLVADWEVVMYSNRSIDAHWQTRLYERNNTIEFIYGACDDWSSYSLAIGISTGSNDYGCITSSDHSISYTSAHRNNNPPAEGRMYTFRPCLPNVGITGYIAEGGTAKMKNGDSLFNSSTYLVQRGESALYRPVALNNGTMKEEACEPRAYTYELAGANPGDYGLSDSPDGPFTKTLDGSLDNLGTNRPYILFDPKGIGTRSATLKISDDNGFSRTYTLVAQARTRLRFIGDVAQGGTESMAEGDSLMESVSVPRLTSRDIRPFTVLNFGDNPAAPATRVTYKIIDPTKQYALVDPVSGAARDSLASDPFTSGGSATPTIRFMPRGVGFLPATLIVGTEDGRKTFYLNAYSSAPGADFFVNGARLNSELNLFKRDFLCAGESAQIVPITVRNIGDGPFNIMQFEAYETDTLFGQGVPPYPLRRDDMMRLIPTSDYVLLEYPGVAPISANSPTTYPVTTEEKTIRTLYLMFVPQRPGKRFTRIYMRTNAANFSAVDHDGVLREGLLTFDVFGRGVGTGISSSAENGARPGPVAFAPAVVGKSVTKSVMLHNSGACDLRVDRAKLRVVSGDVAEFRVGETFPTATFDQATGTYVIAPGDSAAITFVFTPIRTGARKATALLQTNDSTMILPGFTERGAFYWDLYGAGLEGTTASNIRFEPSIIDATGEESPAVGTSVENTSRTPTRIDSVTIIGTDAAEFTMDPARPWPATPFTIPAGGRIELSVKHIPAPGSRPGPRNARLLLFASNGDTIFVELAGEAGTRILTVGPASLFEDVKIPVGKSSRRTVMISNTGTMPLTLGTTVITGPGAGDYMPGRLPRLTLAPGQTEYLELTYRPLGRGTSTATLTVNADGTNGAQSVALGGTATTIRPETGEPGAVSGVDETTTEETALLQSVPNPARDAAEITYRLVTFADVDLRLYDETGREVMVIDNGRKDAGSFTVRVDVGALPAGVYHYRMVVDGRTLVRSMRVVR